MKKCPFCGATQADDNVFCTECGKPIPQVNKCPHCGASVNEGDVFCQNCGKKIAEESVPASSTPSHDAGASRDDVEVQVNEINDSEEYNYNVVDEKRTWRDNILYIVGAVVIIGVLGAMLWNYYSSSQRAERNIAIADSLDKARKDSVLQVRQMEKAKQDSIYKAQQEEKEFLENFYKNLDYSDWEELGNYVRKNVTSNALQTLRDEYSYDCEDGDCLALWIFSYQAGGDWGNELDRKIEQVSENTFLVTTTWGYSDDSSKSDYKVRLGIVKEGDLYKIDTIVDVNEEEREKAYKDNSNQYSKYVGRWILRKTTDEGRKMLLEVKLKENHHGEFAAFKLRGDVQEVIVYEEYTQCILSDGVIYMTKDGDINGKGVPKLRVGSDGLYSYDGDKYERQSE